MISLLCSPQLDIASDWNNHAFDVHANATIGRHTDQTEEDFEDFSVGANGRLDNIRQTSRSTGRQENIDVVSGDLVGEQPEERSSAKGLQHILGLGSYETGAHMAA